MSATGEMEEAGLVMLASYAPPALPTDEWLRMRWAHLKAMFSRGLDRPMLAEDRLERATLKLLDSVVAPPACGPVIAELAAFIALQEAAPTSANRVTLIAVPPCDENDVVGTWAAGEGLAVLSPPSRALLASPPAEPTPPPDLSGTGLLVIPGLERWMLRHQTGLGAVRALLAAIDASDRRVVVGCSSWGWAFLSHAVSADLIMPEPITFRAFDADRLRDWFGELNSAEGVRFRMVDSGLDVLAGGEEGDFFERLAALARGIPWIAWHLWRQALRSNDDDEVPTADDHGRQRTLWVAALSELILPGHHPQVALLVLHALLIHGPLTLAELELTVPIDGRGAVVSSLVRSGFLERHGTVVRVRSAAYPSIRAGLQSAGFPVSDL